MWPFSKPQFTVLVVCTANICRSAAAEALLRARLKQLKAGRKVRVVSAGIEASGSPMPPDPRMIALARELGVSLRGVSSSPINEEQVIDARWIWCMDNSHIEVMRRRFPDLSSRIALFDPEGLEVLDPFFGSKASVRSAFEQLVDISRRRAEEIIRALSRP